MVLTDQNFKKIAFTEQNFKKIAFTDQNFKIIDIYRTELQEKIFFEFFR
jgi:hypothetical protein